MQKDERQGLYKPAQVQKYLGITRSVLTYWVDKLGLIEPAKQLPGLNLFDFGNLLNLGLIKTLTGVGLKASELRAVMLVVNRELGHNWEAVKEIYKKRDAGLEQLSWIGLHIGMDYGRDGKRLRVVIRDSVEKPGSMLGSLKKDVRPGSSAYRIVAQIEVPLNTILVQTSIMTHDYSWWPKDIKRGQRIQKISS